MFDKNILDADEKELQNLKELIQNKEQQEKNLKALESQEKNAIKQLEKKKKEIEKAISENERSEREKAAAPFNDKIEELEKNKKESLEEQKKARKEKIDEEIKEQTSGWQDIKKEHKQRIKQLAQEDNIPFFGISELFFAFYYPKNRKDMLFLLAGILVIFLFIPFGYYYLFWKDGGKLALVSIYLIITVIFALLYMIINNGFKEKHLESYKKINLLRCEKNKTEQDIRDKIQQIEKKSDEELLGHEQSERYQSVLKELETQLKYQKEEKEKALANFDQDIDAKEKRAQNIRDEHKPELDMIYGNIDEIQRKKDSEKALLDEIQNELDSEKYKPLQEIEKNIYKVKVLDELIGYINNGEAKNIRLAIEKYKNPKGASEEK